MNLNQAKQQIVSLIQIIDDGAEVVIKLGDTILARILEDDGRWYLSDSYYKRLGMSSYNTPNAAFAALLEYWKNE